MTETKGILLAGVGGQGILRASDILCEIFISASLDVKKSEVHGMAQRGGCVTSHVRYGQKVHSPLSKKNDMDILVSFEQLDTLRYLDYVKESGTIIVNTETIFPPSVNLGEAIYPSLIVEMISHYFPRVVAIEASKLALQAGNIRTVNTVLMGAVSIILDLPSCLWETVLQRSFPSPFIGANLEAFRLGRSAV